MGTWREVRNFAWHRFRSVTSWESGRGAQSVTSGGTISLAPNHCGARRKVPKMSQVLSSI